MAMHFFDLATTPATPWKNGGGSTQEIACWPPGAGMDGFEWRVSLATVDRPGPFSVFPGIDRQIMLLDGDGLHLRGPGWAHRLEPRWQPFAFAGDDAVDGAMLGGPSRDFNLMLRRGAWRGTLQVVRAAPASAATGLCLVLQGQWQAGPRTLGTGQGCWWVDGGAPGAVQPAQGEGAEPVLAWIALEPVF